MLAIKDVKRWQAISGVSHIVSFTNGGWSHLLCDSFVTGRTQRKAGPRICRECRERGGTGTAARGGGGWRTTRNRQHRCR